MWEAELCQSKMERKGGKVVIKFCRDYSAAINAISHHYCGLVTKYIFRPIYIFKFYFTSSLTELYNLCMI